MDHARPHPFRGFLDLFVELERMRQTGRSGGERAEGQVGTHGNAWVPATDVFADGADLVIRVDLAGVRPDDISITFDGGMLTISGERRSDLPDDTPFYVRELHHGPFHRSMVLPEDVDDSMITAAFEDGVARITIAGGSRSGKPSRIPLEDRSSQRVTRVGTRRPL